MLSGYSYETAKELKQLEDNIIEFTGDAYSLLKIYDKIMACEKIKVSCDKTREEIEGSIKLVSSPYHRFILDGGGNMTKDTSKITIKFMKR